MSWRFDTLDTGDTWPNVSSGENLDNCGECFDKYGENFSHYFHGCDGIQKTRYKYHQKIYENSIFNQNWIKELNSKKKKKTTVEI